MPRVSIAELRAIRNRSCNGLLIKGYRIKMVVQNVAKNDTKTSIKLIHGNLNRLYKVIPKMNKRIAENRNPPANCESFVGAETETLLL